MTHNGQQFVLLPFQVGCAIETLHVWVLQHEQDIGAVMVVSPPLERQRLKDGWNVKIVN